MRDQKTSPAPEAAGGGAASKGKTNRTKVKLTKRAAVLQALLEGPLTGRDAFLDLGDTCLHSTIANIEREYRIRVERVMVKVPTRYGSTRVAKYWLGGEARQQARKVLGQGGAA